MLIRKIKNFFHTSTGVLTHKLKTNREDKNSSKKRLHFALFKNKWMIALTSVLIFVLSLGIISFVTKTNVITYITERILKELGIYTSEVRSVEIESSDYSSNTPGSWHINKSAKWTGLGKAQVTFDVNSVIKTGNNYKDIVLVLDISGSMMGEKLEKAKSDSKELITYLLNDSHNRVAIITFDDSSKIVSEFSNNKEDLITKIDALAVNGGTNYNAALLTVDSVMKVYLKEPNRDVVTLFLTDGYPCVDIPNQIGTYELLKDKYPYMLINGIQYEMGLDIIEEIREITDSAWVADQSTLNNVLFDASVSPIVYENFTLIDYIDNDYFTIDSVDDIKVSIGSITLSVEDGVQKITWNLGNNSFRTGGNAKMTINLSLKEEYIGSEGYYSTNKKERIETKLPEETLKTVDSGNTPVLKNSYEVIYDTNTPAGCSFESIPIEKYSPYQNVTKKQTKLSCNGYLFKGWEIDKDDSKDIKKVNDDVFIMPGHNVTIRATWTKQSVVKSMDGIVHEKISLYDVLRLAAEEGTYAKEYTGDHQDSMAGSGTEKIYHWYAENDTDGTAILDKNNVVFAGYCWQMIRTTDTGGVKMIYNGEPDSEGKCGTSRGDHNGVVADYSETKDLNGNYIYGTGYTYDELNKTFTLTDTETAIWSDDTYENLIGKYTCGTASDNCATLYQVELYDNSTTAYVIPYTISTTVIYDLLGGVPFSVYGSSPAMVGYMYNKEYNYELVSNSSSGQLEIEPIAFDEYNIITPQPYLYKYDETTRMWISTNHTDNITGTIEFSPKTEGNYYLSYEISSQENSDKAKFYVDNVLKDTVSGRRPSAIELGNLTTSSVIKVEYTKDGYFSMGSDQVKFGLAKKPEGVTDNRWLFGQDAEYKDGKYTLKNTVPLDLRWDYNKLNYNHYTCLNEGIKNLTTGEVSCEKVKYIYSGNSTSMYYIELENGNKVEQALEEMLSVDNVNKYNSSIKGNIDAWYEMNMMDYSDYLEDTIFCNNRSIRDLGGWNPNGGDLSVLLQFKEYYNNETTDLSCENITDRFSVSNEKARLKYKIGLMTIPEVNLLNNNNIRKTRVWYWLGSPSFFDYTMAGVRIVYNGTLSDNQTSSNIGVRPAISLKPGTEYSSGNGSMDNPYVVEVER